MRIRTETPVTAIGAGSYGRVSSTVAGTRLERLMTSSDPDASRADRTADLTFADLRVHPSVLQAVADVGYETPSPIQAATIPPLLAGRDVVGLAQTGTGKTAAFALPILSRLDLSQKKPAGAGARADPRAGAPGVRGVREVRRPPAAACTCCRSTAARGTASSSPRCAAASHVVVGTPGRIMDHLDKGTLDLTELRFLVLDEADEMLNMGFAEDVETILADTPDDKQVALFSATMPAADPRHRRRSTCTTRSRSPSRARPRPRPTSPSAT